MKSTQKGFTVVEIAIALVIVGALVFGGYTVWQRSRPVSKASNVSAIYCDKLGNTTGNKLPENQLYCYNNNIAGEVVNLVKPQVTITKLSDVDASLQSIILHELDKRAQEAATVTKDREDYVYVYSQENFTVAANADHEVVLSKDSEFAQSPLSFFVPIGPSINLYAHVNGNWTSIDSIAGGQDDFNCGSITKYKVPKTFLSYFGSKNYSQYGSTVQSGYLDKYGWPVCQVSFDDKTNPNRGKLMVIQ